MTELAIGLGVAGFITSLFGILVAVLIRQLRYMRFRAEGLIGRMGPDSARVTSGRSMS